MFIKEFKQLSSQLCMLNATLQCNVACSCKELTRKKSHTTLMYINKSFFYNPNLHVHQRIQTIEQSTLHAQCNFVICMLIEELTRKKSHTSLMYKNKSFSHNPNLLVHQRIQTIEQSTLHAQCNFAMHIACSSKS